MLKKHDGIKQQVFPILASIAVNYAEACTVCLIKSGWCAWCLIKKNQLGDLSKTAHKRTPKVMKQSLQCFQETCKPDKKLRLANIGLHPIEVRIYIEVSRKLIFLSNFYFN